MLRRAIIVCTGLIVAVPLSAQTPGPVPTAPPAVNAPTMPPPTSPTPGDSDDARFTFNRVQDGYLRLDVRTGQVALCSRRQVGWACQVLPDDRLVLESEIARLQTENGALKRELLSRGLPLPSGVSAPPAAAKSEQEPKSSRSDLQRALGAVEGLWRRLVDAIADWQRDVFKKS